MWRSADDVPRGKDGRILAHIALNGHGSYPTAGFIPRNLLAFNDYTSNQGAVWDPVSISLNAESLYRRMHASHETAVCNSTPSNLDLAQLSIDWSPILTSNTCKDSFGDSDNQQAGRAAGAWTKATLFCISGHQKQPHQ